MSLSIGRLGRDQHAVACVLLTEAFVIDGGMRALFKAHGDRDLRRQLAHWFSATLVLHDRLPAWVVCDGAQLAAVALFTHGATPPSVAAAARWTLTVAARCGAGVVWRTLQHDRRRAAYRPAGPHTVLEFIAVAATHQGRGLMGGLLEAVTPTLGPGPIWLETTRPHNLTRFARYGFRMVAQTALDGGQSMFMEKT